MSSDLHGSTVCWQKFFRAPEFYGADVLLLAGDLTGKAIVPIIRLNGRATALFKGRQWELSLEEIAVFEKNVEAAGLYPYVTTPAEVTEFQERPGIVDTIFHRLVLERLTRWMEMAEDRLSRSGKECFVIAGNDDYLEIDDVLRQGRRVHLVDGKRALLDDGHELVGLGVANMTPWHAPRDVSEEEIASRLAVVVDQLERPETAILMLHVPPAGSLLDLAPKLDKELRPVSAGAHLIHVGSTAVRQCIERVQPLLTLHGHVHESRAIDKIGRTTCINPGSEYHEGQLRAVIVNVSANRVQGHLFVSG